MSNLVNHARTELERAGMFDKDSDYNGALGESILNVVKIFADEEHSGASAAVCIVALEKLLRFETLTPLTDDPSEWMDVSESSGRPMWQNRRDSCYFSTDNGKSWYNVNDKLHRSRKA